MRVAIFCGSSMGKDPAYAKAAEALGVKLAELGHTAIYGGGNVGLMGIMADACLANGGSVIGVIPEFLLEAEKGHEGIFRLEIVDTMEERKARMMELADAFLALPGGPGTMEEIFTSYVLRRLGRHEKPCLVYNVNHYYDTLETFMEEMVQGGFLPEEEKEKLVFFENLGMLDAL